MHGNHHKGDRVNIVTKSEVGKMSKAESMAYIDALTTEVDRLQRRSRAHRQNIRSMSAKLELANAKAECYTKTPRPVWDAYRHVEAVRAAAR